MPQMSPMWWMSLMLTFNIMYMITNTMIYFDKKKKMSKTKKHYNKKMTWKW